MKYKYLLTEWDQLESLLKKCLVFERDADILKTVSRESLIEVHVKCEEDISEWTYQSFRNSIVERNMALSAGIVVLTGMAWSSSQRALSVTVQIIGERTFSRIQKKEEEKTKGKDKKVVIGKFP